MAGGRPTLNGRMAIETVKYALPLYPSRWEIERTFSMPEEILPKMWAHLLGGEQRLIYGDWP